MLWSSTTLLASGFNCAKASTAIEKAICANRSLSQMDSSLGKLYSQRLKGLLKAETNQLKEEQREWLAQRNNCSAMDVDCLLSSYYKQRIAELTTEGQNSPANKEVSEEEFEESPITETSHKQTKSTVQTISPISDTVKPISDKPKPVTKTTLLPTMPVAANAWCGIVNTEKSSLEVHAGLSQDTRVVATAIKGSALTCTDTTQTDWYKVTLDDGKTGYAYAPGEFILGPGPGREARCGTVETEDATLNVRAGMGTNTKVIDKVRKNAMIRILDNRGEEGEWLKVQIDNGKLGYVRKKFVDISETVSETVKPTSEEPKPVTEATSPPKELQAVESTPKSEKPKPVTETTSPPTELQPVESTPKSDKPKPVTETISPAEHFEIIEIIVSLLIVIAVIVVIVFLGVWLLIFIVFIVFIVFLSL